MIMKAVVFLFHIILHKRGCMAIGKVVVGIIVGQQGNQEKSNGVILVAVKGWKGGTGYRDRVYRCSRDRAE